MSTCCYTSFNLAYLPRATVLVESLRRAHPDWQLYAILVDEPAPDDATRLAALFDGLLTIDDLGIEHVRAWMFKHDPVEACTAVKGHAMVKLLQAFDTVIYFDPDIAVFHPLDDLKPLLIDSSIILTPHQIEPNVTEQAVGDNELISMKYGIFNLGFIAVAADAVGRRFAAWWASHLHRACYDDIPNGIFTDQKYCDLVPALFSRVHVHRHPGYNVASWNLSTRLIDIRQDGSIRVNGLPLHFYHFTKIGGDGDTMVARYAGSNIAVHEIWEWYRRQITAHAASKVPRWAYGCFTDGAPIPRSFRLLYRHRVDLQRTFANPFDASPGGYAEWVRVNRPDLVVELSR